MKSKNTKLIIISIIAVIIIAGISVGALALVKRFTTPVVDTTVQADNLPGSSVSIDKAPAYRTCELVSRELIATTLGDRSSNLTDGERGGVIANTGKIAEDCEYTFMTEKSPDNSISIQSYEYATTTEAESSKEAIPADWLFLSYATLPSYFNHNTTSDGSTVVDTLRVIIGPKNFLFIIRQPKGSVTYEEMEMRILLINLSSEAAFDVTNPTDAPPAPDVPVTETTRS